MTVKTYSQQLGKDPSASADMSDGWRHMATAGVLETFWNEWLGVRVRLPAHRVHLPTETPQGLIVGDCSLSMSYHYHSEI